MRILHRVFIAALIFFAGFWIWETVLLRHQIEEDKAFHAQHVAPALAASNTAPLDEWIHRMGRRAEIAHSKFIATTGLIVTSFAWMVFAQVQLFLRRRHSESPDRTPARDAGVVVGDLIERGMILEAKEEKGTRAKSVRIDGTRAVVVFKNFTFVANFIRNPRQELVELPITDLLAGSFFYNKGHVYFHLRTTRGRVIITESVRPFQTLAETLLDAIELNRTSPEAYRAALAREPVIRTPWYGWLIIAAAIAGVAAVGWSVFGS